MHEDSFPAMPADLAFHEGMTPEGLFRVGAALDPLDPMRAILQEYAATLAEIRALTERVADQHPNKDTI